MRTQGEMANTITHGIGLVLSVIAFGILMHVAWIRGSALNIAACTIYGIGLMVVYVSSTFHHGFSNPRVKHWFLKADHCSIYLLIAGTYTPFMLRMPGLEGTLVLASVWTVGGAGIAYKAFAKKYRENLSILMYVLMGWMVMLIPNQFLSNTDPTAVKLLVAGGVLYTSGLIFFHLRKRFSHMVWHLFVLAASGLHYASVFYTLP